ncbi:MAG: DUF202 domain-containing protein [Psychromonas sp.]
MSVQQRDPGLQPERTSLSWRRTQLLMVGVGVLLLKVSEKSSNIILLLGAITLLSAAVFLWHYSQQRFSYFFQSTAAVGNKEATIKIVLSVIIFVIAILYGVLSLIRFSYM